MPQYVYKCSKCGDTHDEYQKIDDRELPTKSPCQKCGEMGIEKQITCTQGFLTDTSTNGGLKRPAEFTDFLKQLKTDSGKHSTIDV